MTVPSMPVLLEEPAAVDDAESLPAKTSRVDATAVQRDWRIASWMSCATFRGSP